MRRFQLITLLAFLTLALSATAVSAQTGQLRGHVLIKQADGTTVPAAGAQIDVYRTEPIPGKYPSKADKKGQFIYAGLPYVGTYVIAASAPNAAPTAQGNVKAGRDADYEIVLSPGDGKRLTEEEAKAAVGGGGSGSQAGESTGESAATKAKREEEAKKYEAEKSRVTNINDVLNRTFKAGKDAMTAKNYDEAIKQF